LKRSAKFYRKNEAETMKMLGFDPTPNSGSGWIVKEDGQSENGICQLKSTDANSIKLNLKDIQTLEYNALVAKKVPVFAIQFLGPQELYVVVKPEYLTILSEIIKTGQSEALESFMGLDIVGLEETKQRKPKMIKSSQSAREEFALENEGKYKKKRKEAR
jgi:hypothetical protein